MNKAIFVLIPLVFSFSPTAGAEEKTGTEVGARSEFTLKELAHENQEWHKRASKAQLSRLLENRPTSKKHIPRWQLALGRQSSDQCHRDEGVILNLEEGLIKELKAGLRLGDFTLIQKHLSSNAKATEFMKMGLKSFDSDGINVTSWVSGDRKSASDVIKNYRKTFTQVEYVDLFIQDYFINNNDRDKNLEFKTTSVILQADIRGNQGAVRRQDRGTFTVRLEREASGFKIADIQVGRVETIRSSRAPAFAETTQLSALGKLPVYLRTEAIRRGGYTLAITDVNGDSISDILVGMRDETKLLIGDKSGGFSEKKDSGLEKLKFVKTAIFADLENRGSKDLVVTLFHNSDPNKPEVELYKNDGKGRFARAEFKKPTSPHLSPMPASLADFDNDGYLDLYVGYPGSKDFSVLIDVNRGSKKHMTHGIFMNDKKGGFVDQTLTALTQDDIASGKTYPHASLAVDLNDDGKVDLLVADDRNNLSPVFINKGDGTFSQGAEPIGLGNRGFAMSLASGDFNNDGLADLAMSNVNFEAMNRFDSACRRQWEMPMARSEAGLRLFENKGNGQYLEVTNSSIGQWVGQGAAGMTFVDYDNDGLVDIYLTNGLWSGAEGGTDISSLFSMVLNDKSTNVARHLGPQDRLSFMDMLTDETGTKVKSFFPYETAKDSTKDFSMLGHQRNRLFKNAGHGKFVEVGFIEGVDSIADGYIAGVDVGPTGFPNLILRNGDPGSKVFSYPVVQFFTNRRINANKSLVIELEGKLSNKEAIGASVTVQSGDSRQIQYVTSNSGSLQVRNTLHFGLRDKSSADVVTVKWPSGRVTTKTNVKSGTLKIVEDESAMHQARNAP